MNLPNIRQPKQNVTATRIFNIVMMLYAAIALQSFLKNCISRWDYVVQDFANEFLINYQGGFVRRGLIGEVIHWICTTTGIEAYHLIVPITIVCFVSVCVFFFVKFNRRHLNWWILATPIFLGMPHNTLVCAANKDFMIILMVIAMLYAYRKISSATAKAVVMNLLMVIALNIHEVIFFYGYPVMALLILSDDECRWSKGTKALSAALPIVVFIAICIFKGNADIAQAIHNSWIDYMPEEYGTEPFGSVGAIGWTLQDTIKMHMEKSFFSTSYDIYGIFVRPIIWIFIYYLITNAVFVFKKPTSDLEETDRRNLSALTLMLFVTMLPMFLFLSCDYIRLEYYITATVFATFIIVDREVISRMFPQKFMRVADTINRHLTRLLPPNKGTIALLLLFIADSPSFFRIDWALPSSVAFTLARCASKLCDAGINALQSII